ncbi:bifunctional proline dehydrogenase/L-glutamate gamma-semialdehyde dehydrogenase PutA [Profundibacterium mesophilum]|uniref:Bifunctional protein PutA n=1 Tax=Profundibacterium mesophilum KAUST100406-0324 TaxID=1037889 RepID=A0A921TFT6_9RHOB|nr:bifunctional proline dehydrogenase/L-glutamate gamma-semialdehyde dehydrogenase PutA [Profundibacterium mesophilum]KAF0676754.1 Delta-1-pyrroline-5-carboxylate dehydrogenase L-proline dehydrogenase [Profundibacterium mesophilum KAUST100406-0324]
MPRDDYSDHRPPSGSDAPAAPVLPFGAYPDPDAVLSTLVQEAGLSAGDRAAITRRGAELVRGIREGGSPGLMEVFLAEYGLSTDEGIALMCLAEALLRVPDAQTIDALIEDKIAPSDWGRHLGHSSSSLVNASTWALMLTGRVLDDRPPGLAGHLRGALKRLGEPVIRRAVGRAMREMGRQFVLGQTMPEAMRRAAKMEEKGYTYSYDMLGEAACTEADAARYHRAYADAIETMAAAATHGDIRRNPGISVKLSALHPRYEWAQRERVLKELVPRLATLAARAAHHGIGLNIDAEEAARLELSLEVIGQVLADPALAGWDGFGVVVQAYGPRAGAVIDWLHDAAGRHGRKLMVRLVKGAYWDSEIKLAQVNGLPRFPVFSRKPATDVSYIANARKLLGRTNRLYPQFATHNAHTVAAILHMAGQMEVDAQSYEFQRLHGMGEKLHGILRAEEGTRCRIYAPVGAHRDLLAYLVRRLLENGANSSFVNQIVDEAVPPEEVAADPFDALGKTGPVAPGAALFAPERVNSRGWDLSEPRHLAQIEAARAPFAQHVYHAAPLLAGSAAPQEARPVHDPAAPDLVVGDVREASPADAETALAGAAPWDAAPKERAMILERAADLFEEHHGEIFALLAREAGKTLPDAVGELREAVDFLRYYASRIDALDAPARGVFTCISPWNFPLAIFTGQIAGALAAGNGVIAKPAGQTPLIGHLAAGLMLRAGVPGTALQFLPGGGEIGAILTREKRRIAGVAFTGSTRTARHIQRSMAEAMAPGTPLIAETGGLNAMIVDSTALLEQAVRDVVISAFQSAGQRCSALRCLYVQEDIAEEFLTMLRGAVDSLRPAHPWRLSSDSGPLIDAAAHEAIADYVEGAAAQGRVLHRGHAPAEGYFLAPTIVSIPGIEALEREVFGPVLHVARFASGKIDAVIDAVNATGYGLTFGLHTRIDARVQHVVDRVTAGNLYVNRNQIGAIVGSQPFGGEGLSGTGPKAGGPDYMARFTRPPAPDGVQPPRADEGGGRILAPVSAAAPARALASAPAPSCTAPSDLPGPTGESNRLRHCPRPPVICAGPGEEAVRQQAEAVRALGGTAQPVDGMLDPSQIGALPPFGALMWWGEDETARGFEKALAERDGPITGLVVGMPIRADAMLERHVCVDTTASGGNAALLAEAADDIPHV